MRLLVPGAVVVEVHRRHRAAELGEDRRALARPPPGSGRGSPTPWSSRRRARPPPRRAPPLRAAAFSAATAAAPPGARGRRPRCGPSPPSSARMPSASSQAIDRSERKLRTGDRAASGSGPIWITPASGPRPVDLRRPRREASSTRIASAARERAAPGSAGAAIGCVGRHRQRQRPVLADRDRPLLGERRERREALGAARAVLGEDHRMLGLGEDARRLGDLRRARPRHRRRHRRRRVEPLGRRRLAQHLARQADVDRAPRRRVGDRAGPVERARAPARGSAARSPTCSASRTSAVWSRISCPQPIGTVRAPKRPSLGRRRPPGEQERSARCSIAALIAPDRAVGEADVGVRRSPPAPRPVARK